LCGSQGDGFGARGDAAVALDVAHARGVVMIEIVIDERQPILVAVALEPCTDARPRCAYAARCPTSDTRIEGAIGGGHLLAETCPECRVVHFFRGGAGFEQQSVCASTREAEGAPQRAPVAFVVAADTRGNRRDHRADMA